MTAEAERPSVLEPPQHGLQHDDRGQGARLRLTIAAVCVALCGLIVLSAPASAAPLSACTPHRGTIVAVDFAHWGGPIVRGCGINEPSGYALLHAAGFLTAGDTHDGAAFICRLGNQVFHGGTMYPTARESPCSGTPSSSAYWSFWVAPPGQNAWTYSPLGPMGDSPRAGEVELWMFGATNVAGTRGSGVPGFSPSTLRPASPAPTTRPLSTPSRTATTTTHAPSAPKSPARASGVPTAKRRAAAKSLQPQSPARKRPRAPRPVRQTAIPTVSAKPTSARTSSGSAGPLVVGLCLALMLVTGAVWSVRRRRRYE